MKRIYYAISISLLFLTFLSACGGSQSESDAAEADAQIDDTPRNLDPCSLLNRNMVVEELGEPDGQMKVEDRTRQFPTCQITWVASTKKIMEMPGGDVEVEQENRVTLIIPDKEITPEMFEQSTSVYSDGVEVPGLGNQAVWSDEMHQLSVREDEVLFHLNVEYYDDEQVKDQAIAMARKILERM